MLERDTDVRPAPASFMDAIRIVVVDDSALFRTLLRNVLTEIPGCEVIASVADGASAVEKISTLKPDLVTLDVEMPNLSGIDVLRELKKKSVKSRIVMVSRLTAAGAQVTTDALIEGAFDFILKPSGGNPAENKALLKAALEERIAAVRETDSPPSDSVQVIDRKSAVGDRIDAIIIGCSTGGPDALAQVIPDLPANFPVPVFVIQHMPERFTASLAARLNEASELEVVEASDGLCVRAGQVVIARGGRHLELERITPQGIVVGLTEAPHEHGCRPAVDVALRSAVKLFQGRLLVVILTGMGKDGVIGCKLAHDQGGHVVVQHADGCTVYGMPKAVINAGVADEVVVLQRIPNVITRLTCR